MPTVLVQNEALEVEIDSGENLQQGLLKYGITVYDFRAVHPFGRPITAVLLIFFITLTVAVFGFMIAGMGGLVVGTVIGALFALWPVGIMMMKDHTQVMVMNGRDGLSEPSERESRMLGDELLAAGYRLASEAKVVGNCEVHCHP